MIIEKEIAMSPHSVQAARNTLFIGDGFRPLLFDIETTGFSRDYAYISVIGSILLSDNDEKFEIVQLFSESKSDEKSVISAFADALGKCDMLITFNGNSFDIPFIRAKLRKYGFDDSVLEKPSLDLLEVSRQAFSRAKNLKLKDIEKELGIDREDTISGKDAADSYLSYLKTGDKGCFGRIMLHNKEDVVNMLDLLRLLSEYASDEKAIVIPRKISDRLILDRAAVKGDFLEATVFVSPGSSAYAANIGCEMNLDYTFDMASKKVSMRMPLMTIGGFSVIDTLAMFNTGFNELSKDMVSEIIIQNSDTKSIYVQNVVLNINRAVSKIVSFEKEPPEDQYFL